MIAYSTVANDIPVVTGFPLDSSNKWSNTEGELKSY